MAKASNDLAPDKVGEKLDEAFGTQEEIAAKIAANVPPPPRVPVPPGLNLFGTRKPVPMIYAKLADVMAELPAVGKDSRNEQQGWNFRGVDAVVNAISPALRKHGVGVVPKVLDISYRDTTTAGRDPRPTREVTVKVKYTFFAEDGSSVSAIVPGESLDQSDKGSAKAMSVAFRIALLQVFALPTSEPDPDASYHTRSGETNMTPATAKTALWALLDLGTFEGIRMGWQMVVEHAAQERAVPADLLSDTSGLTWHQVTRDMLVKGISRIESWEEGKAWYELVKDLGFHDLDGNLKIRADFLAQRRREAFDSHMQAITTATTPEGLEAATVAAGLDLDKGVLSEAQATELHKVAHERGAKLKREQSQEEPLDTDPSGSES